MEDLYERGKALLKKNGVEYDEADRMGLVLGTVWSDPQVLEQQGFKLDKVITFDEAGLKVGSGVGHPNRFLLGTLKKRPVVASQGRVHCNQDTHWQDERLVRNWFSMQMALMGRHEGTTREAELNRRLVLTSLVGGLNKWTEMGLVVMPTRMECGDITDIFLLADEGEYVNHDNQIWAFPEDSDSEIVRPGTIKAFEAAAEFAGLKYKAGSYGYVVKGPGFGGAHKRRELRQLGYDTIGMSIIPCLYLLAVVNHVRKMLQLPPYEVVGMSKITDNHDWPDNDEIQAEAKRHGPKLGTCLSHIVEHSWMPNV